MQALLWVLLLVSAAWVEAAERPTRDAFVVVAYHDVRDDPMESPDRYTVSTRNLAAHFSWLKANGYSVIGIEDLLEARAGRKALPPKSLMLTFDDGYRSVYTQVYPLLRAFGYRAVIGLVGRWLTDPTAEPPAEEGGIPPQPQFLSWAEIREMVLSGLVEVASHTHDLHRGLAGNPQGDLLPAAVARQFSPAEGRYETDAQYVARVRSDLERNSALIRHHLGLKPRAVVWPYGRHSGAAIRLARENEMPLGFILGGGSNTSSTPLETLRRELIAYDPDVSEFAKLVAEASRATPIRVMHVDLDYVYDPDPAQQRRNLGRLLDRVREMGINTVYLQAYADPDGNGAADALYFPNRHLPVRADLFSHVAWQLHTRAGVNVYAWMPVLAFEMPLEAATRVQAALPPGSPAAGYPRLSPFDSRARRIVHEIYEDLGRHAIIQGLLFHDDATFTDYEDASAPALRHYNEVWGYPPDVAQLRAHPAVFREWTRRKSAFLTQFTLDLARSATAFQQDLPLARNLYARIVLQPQAEEWFAQNLSEFLKAYDYTAIMAMPFLEGAQDPLPWVSAVARVVAGEPGALPRTVFELQAKDWRDGTPISSKLIAQKMRALQLQGALNFGYYPDDFHRNHPDLVTIKPVFSLETFPYEAYRPR